MSQSSSSHRTSQPPRDTGTIRLSPSGEGSSRSAAPLSDDQPTIISSQPPLGSGAISDSAFRIVEGNIAPGDRLGCYDLVEYVGGGGMGRVFRATDTQLGRTVALKVLLPDQVRDEETIQRFRNEARSAARLDHDNIARVFHVGEDRGLHYIVFEFIEGENIRELVERKGPLPLAEAVSYALQAAEALAHAVDRRVVHRDIKPSNLLVTPDARVKLIDLGLARLAPDDKAQADLTATGVTLGTFDYISPEQARDPRNADVRSDIYSLGCTVFYMLTGRPPFPEGTVLQKLLQHQGDAPPEVREFRRDIPEEAAATLRKMLAKDPCHRYADPNRLVDDLLALAQQVGLQAVGPGRRILVIPRPWKPNFLQRHLPWMAPVATLLCIVLLLDYRWSSSAKEEQALVGSPEVFFGEIPDPAEWSADDSSSGATEAIDAMPPVSPPEEPALEKPPVPPAPTLPEPPSPDEATAVDEASTAFPAAPVDGESGLPERRPADPPAETLGFDPASGDRSVAEDDSRGLYAAAEETGYSGDLSSRAGRPAEVASNRKGLLVVCETPDAENEFSTLAAACSAATNNDIIELRYNGRRAERPIKLGNLKATLRAGAGYQPIVVFRPTEMDAVKTPPTMIHVTAGRLKLINLALEFHVPRDVRADHWSLIEALGEQSLRLENCCLTVFNASDDRRAYHEDVAFFRFQPPPGSEVGIGQWSGETEPAAVVEMVDCIARGEATFLRSERLQRVDLSWENGLLVTSEELLLATAGYQTMRTAGTLQLDLRHLTAVVRNGFRWVTSAPQGLELSIHCTDSILATRSGGPLLQQSAPESIGDQQIRVSFAGDRNFYEGIDTFWAIGTPGQVEPLERLGFEAWCSYWGPELEHLPSLDSVGWAVAPPVDVPAHRQTPSDYRLDSTPNLANPARRAASDGSDAGVQAERLPGVPPPIATASPAPVEPAD